MGEEKGKKTVIESRERIERGGRGNPRPLRRRLSNAS